MAEEGTYEYELMRADLLGVAPLDKQAFEESQREKALIVQQQLEELAAQSEQMKGATGKLDELNSILLETVKQDKFQKVCFPVKEKDLNLKIDDALDAIDIESNSLMKTTEEIRATKLDLSRQMTSQMDKLESMINQTEKAGKSMEEQNKHLKKFMH